MLREAPERRATTIDVEIDQRSNTIPVDFSKTRRPEHGMVISDIGGKTRTN